MVVSKESKLYHMTSFLNLCKVFGLVSFGNQSRVYKFYIYILISFHIASYIYLTIGKRALVFENFSFISKTADQVSTLALSMSCIITIVSTVFSNPDMFQQLVTAVDYVDNKINSAGSIKQNNGNHIFWLALILTTVDVTVIVGLDSWIWLDSLGFYDFYQYYTARNIQLYICAMTKFLRIWFAIEVSYRFQLTKKALENIAVTPYDIKVVAKAVFDNGKILSRIKLISKLHNILCEALNMINQLYGLSLVFDVLASVSFALEYTILMISYSFIDEDVDGIKYGSNLLTNSCFWIIENCVSI